MNPLRAAGSLGSPRKRTLANVSNSFVSLGDTKMRRKLELITPKEIVAAEILKIQSLNYDESSQGVGPKRIKVYGF